MAHEKNRQNQGKKKKKTWGEAALSRIGINIKQFTIKKYTVSHWQSNVISKGGIPSSKKHRTDSCTKKIVK